MTQADSPISIAEVTAFNPESRINPYPKLKRMRENTPVLFDEIGQTWMPTKYHDVRDLLKDRSIFRHPSNAAEGSFVASFAETPEGSEQGGHSILYLDDPEHTRIRSILSKAFYPRVTKMREQINSWIDEIIESAPDQGTFDVMSEIAIKMPIHVIAGIIGVDDDMLPSLRTWSEISVQILDPLRDPKINDDIFTAAKLQSSYFTSLIRQRKEMRRDDLVSDLVHAQQEGAEISDDEIVSNLNLLLSAGNLTTTDLVGLGTYLLLTHPDELKKVKDHPELIPQAVEEMLRFDSPVAVTARVIMDERQMRGCPMHPKQGVLPSLHAANRDPEVFTDPDVFDVERKEAPHVAFGGGQHICLGAPLARIEAVRFFHKFLEKYPNVTLAEDPDNMRWRTLPLFRGLEQLKVTV